MNDMKRGQVWIVFLWLEIFRMNIVSCSYPLFLQREGSFDTFMKSTYYGRWASDEMYFEFFDVNYKERFR